MKRADHLDCKRLDVLCATGLMAISALVSVPADATYLQANLTSDVPNLAAYTDPNLVNPWGISASSTSPWWVSDNGTGVATLYNGNTGQPSPLVVTVPPPAGSPVGTQSTPTGLVFNGSAGFELETGKPALFLFATRDGTLSGWNPAVNPTNTILKVDNSIFGTYTGLALGSAGAGDFLYAANFANASIDVFDTGFSPAALGGGFTDPNLPSGYAPYNIQNLGGQLYVTYAQVGPNGEAVTGGGLGIVDVFDTNGNFVRRIASGGALDAPWGLALAPSDFGEFSNLLLVGNFGDGLINAFDPVTGQLLGQLADGVGAAIAIEGLRGIGFGNDGNAGAHNVLFFAAGIDGGTHGLFGSLTAEPGSPTNGVPEPGTLGLVIGMLPLLLRGRRDRR